MDIVQQTDFFTGVTLARRYDNVDRIDIAVLDGEFGMVLVDGGDYHVIKVKSSSTGELVVTSDAVTDFVGLLDLSFI